MNTSGIEYFNVVFEFWSAIFCGLTAICVFATRKFDKIEARIVMGLLITNMVLNIAAALAYLYRGNVTTTDFYVVRIANFTVFLCNMIMLFCIIDFLCHLIIINGGRDNKIARMIAERMELRPDEIEDIYQMAILHDIGKIGISLDILAKTGPLTDDEFRIIKSHPGRGSEILDKISDKPELLTGARWHHERYDGKGYPDGLSGENIPLQARIIAMADSYDAMTSNRSYRSYLSQETVHGEIEMNAGTQFDPQIAKIMLQLMDEDTDYNLREHSETEG